MGSNQYEREIEMKSIIKSSLAVLGLIGMAQSPVTWAVPVYAAVQAVQAVPATPAIPAIPGLPGDGAIRAVRAIPAVAPSPVPEPETYVMMLAGLGLIGMVVARRRIY